MLELLFREWSNGVGSGSWVSVRVSILPCQIKSSQSFALSLPFGVPYCKTHPCAVGELGVSELIGMSVSLQPTRALGFFVGDWVQGPLHCSSPGMLPQHHCCMQFSTPDPPRACWLDPQSRGTVSKTSS